MPVKKRLLRLAIVNFCFVSVNGFAGKIRATNRELDRCLQSVKAIRSGYFFKVEKLNFQGKGVYEQEIVDPAHGEWEFLCDAASWLIIEQESEARNASDPAFIKNAKLSAQEAAKIVWSINEAVEIPFGFAQGTFTCVP